MILHAHAHTDALEPLDLVGGDLKHMLQGPAQRTDGRCGRHPLHDLQIALDLVFFDGVLRQRPAGLGGAQIHLKHFVVGGTGFDDLLTETHRLVHAIAQALRGVGNARGRRVDVVLVARVAMVVLDTQAQRQLAGPPELLGELQVRPVCGGQVCTQPIATSLIDHRGQAQRDGIVQVVRKAAPHARVVGRSQHMGQTRAVGRHITGLGRGDASGLQGAAACVVSKATGRITDLHVHRVIGHCRAELQACGHAPLGELPRREPADGRQPLTRLGLARRNGQCRLQRLDGIGGL